MSDLSAKALIMVVSRTDAVEVAVAELGPEIVGVILSQDILGPIVMKCQEMEDRATFRYRIVDSPMEIGDSFERFEHLLSEIEGLGYATGDVVLDVTGGTTPMRFGAALAAMTRGMRMVHQRVPQRFVEGEWILDASRQREIVPMDNPLESTGLLREGQAVELFNRRDYGAAALVFEDVARKVTGVERGHYYNGLLLLAEGYGAWDVADYGTALEKLKLAREELGVGFSEAALAERAGEITGRITAHLPFLGKVRGKLSVENVVDMVENARRRITDQGRYDDGVARLYRAVEMWHQWRLMSFYSIETKKVKWERVDKDARDHFLKLVQTKELPDGLGLRHARILDHILSGKDPEEEDTAFQNLLTARNSSILAHGVDPIGQGTAKRFLMYLDTLVTVPEDLRSGARHADLLAL
ncbi:MAG TPA: TIGR02710 family CRISPR-associated CARF protein [Rubrobacter sp.]|nr:TIGR02710 family CRISPR-associated CARF protein [Rubrobacter sp.]